MSSTSADYHSTLIAYEVNGSRCLAKKWDDHILLTHSHYYCEQSSTDISSQLLLLLLSLFKIIAKQQHPSVRFITAAWRTNFHIKSVKISNSKPFKCLLNVKDWKGVFEKVYCTLLLRISYKKYETSRGIFHLRCYVFDRGHSHTYRGKH